MLMKPVDLAPSPALSADRWVVVFGDRHQFEAYFSEKPKAERYAADHHGIIVPLAALGPWPRALTAGR